MQTFSNYNFKSYKYVELRNAACHYFNTSFNEKSSQNNAYDMHKTFILVNTSLELFHMLLIFSFRDYERHVDLTEEEEGTENQQGTVNRRHHQYNDAEQHGQIDTCC